MPQRWPLAHRFAVCGLALFGLQTRVAHGAPVRLRAGVGGELGANLSNRGGMVLGPSGRLGVQFSETWGLEVGAAAYLAVTPTSGVTSQLSAHIAPAWLVARPVELTLGPRLDAFATAGDPFRTGGYGGDFRVRILAASRPGAGSHSGLAVTLQSAFGRTFGARAFGYYAMLTIGVGWAWQ